MGNRIRKVLGSPAMPVLLVFAFAVAANAQSGSIDTSAFTTLGNKLIVLFQWLSYVCVVAALAFTIFEVIAQNMSRALMGVAGVIISAIIAGFATSWASSLTGVGST